MVTRHMPEDWSGWIGKAQWIGAVDWKGTVDWTSQVTWAGTRLPLTEATGLHPGMYSDESFFAAEQKRLFERAWVAVGTAAEVAEAGRLLVRQVGGRSIIITRDQEGVLHGFVNSCRHRGTELAETDCDIGNTIRCPYHRWGYGLDGSLRSTPFFEEIPREGFDRDDFGLVEVRVDTWGLLLFACLDSRTRPLREWLGDLPDRMGGYGFDQWRVQSEATFEVRANWKLITENFQEYYHLSWVHPELAKVSRVKDHYRYQGPGMYCGQTTTPVSGDDRDDWLVLPPAEGLNQSDLLSGRFVAVFPNVMLAVLPNHVFLIRLEPVANPGLPERGVRFCFRRPRPTSQTKTWPRLVVSGSTSTTKTSTSSSVDSAVSLLARWLPDRLPRVSRNRCIVFTTCLPTL